MRLLILVLALVSPVACVGEGTEEDEGTAAGALRETVGDHVVSGCSTNVVIGLAQQITAELDCVAPGALVSFEGAPGLHPTGTAVLPYVAPDAHADLLAVGRERTVEITSAFRTVPQQLLLRRWLDTTRCNITAAAQAGRSNHETGRAVDFGQRTPALVKLVGRHGWRPTVPGDPLHFDHLASPDIRGTDVLAFQRLWNRNHADDRIAEDGRYTSATETRLLRSPANGFPLGSACSAGGTGAPWVDDSDAERFRAEGAWRSSTSVAGFRGDGYSVLEAGQDGTATWTLGVTEPGSHELWAAFTPHDNRTRSAVYRVRTSDDAEPVDVVVDQRAQSPARLGTFDLEVTASVTVESSDDGTTIADAIRAIPRP